jgi:cytoskeletal protein CcmA (bactofilin family)
MAPSGGEGDGRGGCGVRRIVGRQCGVKAAVRQGAASERGVSFVLVLLGTLLVLLMGLGIVSATSTELVIARNQRDAAQALSIAEAGLERARVKIAALPSWSAGYTNVPFGGGSYTVTVTPIGPADARLTSTGTIGRAKKIISCRVRVRVDSSFYHAFYQAAPFNVSNGTLHIVGGNVYAEGDATINRANVQIDGNLTVGGDIHLSGGSNLRVGGTTTLYADLLPMPKPPESFYRAIASAIYEGDQVWNGITLNDNLLFVHGNLTISGTIHGVGTIVVTGNLAIPSSLTYHEPANDLLSLICFGNALLDAAQINALVYTYNTAHACTHANWLRGSLLAQSIELEQTVHVEMDPRFIDRPTPGLPGSVTDVSEWQEIY